MRPAVHWVSQDWHQSPEGQAVISHLTDQRTGQRKVYGFLERPQLPPTVAHVSFKLYLWGRSGAGKTALVSHLCTAGGAGTNRRLSAKGGGGETPGIQVTQVHWPARLLATAASGSSSAPTGSLPVLAGGRIVLFRLWLWDAGESAAKKYAHVYPVCSDRAAGAILVFSFTDRSSFDEVDTQVAKLRRGGGDQQLCIIVVGTRYGVPAESEVSQQDVSQFESKWQLHILKVRHAVSQTPRQDQHQQQRQEADRLLNQMVDQLWAHSSTITNRGAVILDPALT